MNFGAPGCAAVERPSSWLTPLPELKLARISTNLLRLRAASRKPAATVQVHDSEKILREMPAEDAREIFGQEVTAEWSPEQAVEELRKQRGLQNSQPSRTVKFDFDGRRGELSDKAAACGLIVLAQR